ncbi:hypothetical protein MIND_01084400 [Mycena indigotica]|uniref:Uncharacterized protein n=1 Tax=Mycena indigotica TaxID=2126181 RepID=A0A8H6S9H5_9AGAR|nr:uncharacterized protein MIND_01084400 [Mycena indigotica]KAF7295446.1 hypothetical protein MIND_01084400 [Mycena indigotica]
MARTPKAATKRSATRPTVSFKDTDDIELFDEEDLGGSEDSAEMLNRFLDEYKKKEAKKATARSAAFQNQKKSLYEAARKLARDISREGIASLEEGRAKIQALKGEELAADKFSEDIIPLWQSVEDASEAVLASYPQGIQDLFPRRSKTINTASEMLTEIPTERKQMLQNSLDAANEQMYQSQRDEKLARDASALIKRYKALLQHA